MTRLRGLLALLLGALAVPAGVQLGLDPALRLLTDARPPTLRPLDDVLAGVLGLLLVTASLLWGLSLALAVIEALASPRVAAWVRRLPRPHLARGVALGLLGTVAVGVPAHAGTTVPEPAAEPLAGLPLPDRVATAAPRQPVAPPTRLVARVPTGSVEVRPGDSLWAVAERALGPGASDAAVDAAWRAIAAANARVVDDPDLIFPGTELALPPLPHRKEHP
ncbi:LysM peptidoglycan-binding domain-containing protein [Nocardioides iriomotensis]|nr:LysM peptidoglycan-binding domain-containing protein [Nocardioides iriomotensis]